MVAIGLCRRLALAAVLAAALAGPARANDANRSPEDKARAAEARRGTSGYGAPRAPGSLLLNMLTKNERDNLDRTLPHWAKVIDAWVIGVDEANTDDSVEVIRRHLGHIPGQIVTVHFTGIGPTWTELVDVGVREYPNVTHGIIADADFKPMVDRLDRMELDTRCAKHMYTIWTEDHRNERKMDWIYRNIPGAKVKRRTHQVVEVPAFPHAEVLQTMVNLPLEERTGGYQDRTPGKQKRYRDFLLADLEDFPGDPRTLYYLGYAYYESFQELHARDRESTEAWDNLAEAVRYMKWRTEVEGNEEELWFTILKLGEVHERFYRDWESAERYYQNCTRLDPDRADSWFYLGQHYRLAGDLKRAYKPLLKAATLPIPDRSLFQWHFLYRCVGKLEFGRLQHARIDELKKKKLQRVIGMLAAARCENEEKERAELLAGFRAALDKRRERSKRRKAEKAGEKARARRDEADGAADDAAGGGGGGDDAGGTAGGFTRDGARGAVVTVTTNAATPKQIKAHLRPLAERLHALTRDAKARRKSGSVDADGNDLTVGDVLRMQVSALRTFAASPGRHASCPEYRRATTPFLRLYRRWESAILARADDDEKDEYADVYAQLLGFCR